MVRVKLPKILMKWLKVLLISKLSNLIKRFHQYREVKKVKIWLLQVVKARQMISVMKIWMVINTISNKYLKIKLCQRKKKNFSINSRKERSATNLQMMILSNKKGSLKKESKIKSNQTTKMIQGLTIHMTMTKMALLTGMEPETSNKWTHKIIKIKTFYKETLLGMWSRWTKMRTHWTLMNS